MIYTPKEDSYLLAEEVKKYAKDKSVLDMGTGSGIQALAAKSAGAKSIIVSDINIEAVTQAKKQFKRYKIRVIHSNLFEKVNGKFDLIIFNPPYLPEDKREDKDSALSTTGGKKGDEIIVNFLKKATRHLNNNGIILLLISSLTPERRINNLMKRLKLNSKVIASQKIFFEEIFVLEIKKHKFKTHN